MFRSQRYTFDIKLKTVKYIHMRDIDSYFYEDTYKNNMISCYIFSMYFYNLIYILMG